MIGYTIPQVDIFFTQPFSLCIMAVCDRLSQQVCIWQNCKWVIRLQNGITNMISIMQIA